MAPGAGAVLLSKLLRTKEPLRDPLHGTISPASSIDGLVASAAPGASGGRLKKVLTTLDLTSLGVGSCVGTGMYLVAGMVAHTITGPSVILSFVVAAVASIFSGVCYAEFGVRVPNTSGGAYMYSYVTVGEFMAFVIGWNMVLEELIGTAACACALSSCFDVMLGGAISEATGGLFGTIMGRPPDLIACLLTLAMGAVLIAGVRKSVAFNNVLNSLNFCVWVFLMTAGMFYADFSNWTKNEGFVPHGVSGILTGAATCFYGFIGFDIIATTGEEAVQPVRSIPRAIVLSLTIILIAYVTSSAVVTLMVPYTMIDSEAALVDAFESVGATSCASIVAMGALAGLTVSMFGTMFSLPRIVYAMAKDGLIFKSLAGVWEVTGTPAVATAVFGLGSALTALLFPLTLLVEMMSIGTLLAYTLVSTCVLLLRYQPHSSTLVTLLPESIRTPMAGSPTAGSPTGKLSSPMPGGPGVPPQQLQAALQTQGRLTPTGMPQDQRVTVKRVVRALSDSDDEDAASVDSRKEDEYMVGSVTEGQHRYYGAVPSGTQKPQPLYRRVVDVFWHTLPQLLPIAVHGPCTEDTGRAVARLVGLLYLNILALDVALVCVIGELEGHSVVASVCVVALFLGMLVILLLIARHPQNRKALPFLAPGLPWIPATAILVNVYLILKLNILTLVRFIVWMIVGMAIYFFYGIKESTVEKDSGNFCLEVTSPGAQLASTASLTGDGVTTTAHFSLGDITANHQQTQRITTKHGIAANSEATSNSKLSSKKAPPQRPTPPVPSKPLPPVKPPSAPSTASSASRNPFR